MNPNKLNQHPLVVKVKDRVRIIKNERNIKHHKALDIAPRNVVIVTIYHLE